MDFITDLPASHGKTVIWVVVDTFSKQAHFIPYATIPTAPKLATLFLQHVYRLHGLPKRILSDRGVQFVSKFWRTLLKELGVEQALTSGYHPESNGQTERVNQVLEQYVRCFINYQQMDWVDLFPMAEFAYNNTVHSSIGMTPFWVVYGVDPVAVPSWEMLPSSPVVLQQWSEDIAKGWPQLVQNLEKAKADYKKYADRKRVPAPKWEVRGGAYLSTKNISCSQVSR